LRSVKDTRDDKPGDLFYVPGEMLERDGSSRNVLLGFEKDRGHFDKGEVISRKVGGFRRM
jgi:hypothetical protein